MLYTVSMVKRLAALTIACAVIPALVFAQVSNSALPDSGTTPNSPFYFLKTWKEQIQLFFTFDTEQKARRYLHLAEVRLAEYQRMIEKGTLQQAQGKYQEIADKTLMKYEDQLNSALQKAEELKNKGKDIKDLYQKVEEATSKHLQVLQENLARVPEAAKKGIEKAIEASSKVLDKAVETVGRKSIHQLESEFYGEMDNWQTYRNEPYGFEFRYPSDWIRNPAWADQETENYVSFQSPPKHYKIARKVEEEGLTGLSLEILINPTKEYKNLEEFVDEDKEENQSHRIATPATKLINSVQFYAYNTWHMGEHWHYYTLINHQIIHLRFGLSDVATAPESASLYSEFQKVSQDILSTFKFISPS